jgi:hypothetical protein
VAPPRQGLFIAASKYLQRFWLGRPPNWMPIGGGVMMALSARGGQQ